MSKKPEPAIGTVPVCDACGAPIKGLHLIMSPSNGSKGALFCDWICVEAFASKK